MIVKWEPSLMNIKKIMKIILGSVKRCVSAVSRAECLTRLMLLQRSPFAQFRHHV